jgi:hypothetical protein
VVIQRGEIWWTDLLTVDKRFLTEKMGDLPVYLLEQVEDGLRLVMELG